MKFSIYAQRVFTQDWQRSLAFYRDVLELPLKFSDETLGWAEFDLQGVSLGLERVDDEIEARELVGRFVGLSLQVDDIDQVYQQLTQRQVEFTQPPQLQDWGGVLAHFKDLDGNVLTLLGQSG